MPFDVYYNTPTCPRRRRQTTMSFTAGAIMPVRFLAIFQFSILYCTHNGTVFPIIARPRYSRRRGPVIAFRSDRHATNYTRLAVIRAPGPGCAHGSRSGSVNPPRVARDRQNVMCTVRIYRTKYVHLILYIIMRDTASSSISAAVVDSLPPFSDPARARE